MARPRVAMVHGISDNGDWHGRAARILGVDYDCRPIRYREFHFCPGGVSIFFWPPAVFLFLALAGVIVPILYYPRSDAAVWYGDACLTGLLVVTTSVVLVWEIDWDGPTPFAAVPLLVLAAGWGLAWGAPAGWRQLLLIVALCLEIVFLEARVYYYRDRNYSLQWHVVNLFWPWNLPFAAAGAWAWVRAWPHEAGWTVGVVLLAWALAEPHLRRRRALTKVYQQLNEVSVAGPPHAIVHSMGSYLTVWAVERYLEEGLRLHRLVLVGCVLPQSFPWGQTLLDRHGVQRVRNETGRRDSAVRLVGVGSWLWPELGFGSAGRDGFCFDPIFVHDVANEEHGCAHCPEEGDPAPVHNIRLNAEHATAFLGPSHALYLWLPFLWGMEPRVFRRFLTLCWAGDEALKGGGDNFRAPEEEFWKGGWNWTDAPNSGQQIRAFVKNTLPIWRRHLDGSLTPGQRKATPEEVELHLFPQLCRLIAAVTDSLAPPAPGAAPAPPDPDLLAACRDVLAHDPQLRDGSPQPSDRDALVYFLYPKRALIAALVMALRTLE